MRVTRDRRFWEKVALVALFISSANALTLFSVLSNKPEFFVWMPAYFAVVVWILVRPGRLLNMLDGNLIFIAWPILAMLSAFWSLSPQDSQYQGFQLLMTVLISFLIVTRYTIFEIIVAVFWALFIAQIWSIIMYGIDPAWATDRHGNFKGVFAHKNILAAYCAIQFLTAFCLLSQRWRPLLASATILMSVAFILLSGSATSLLALFILAPCTLLAFACRIQKTLFPLALGALSILLAIAIPTIAVLQIDLFENVLNSVGRSSTLTGRTTIWDFGIDAFWDRPWIGHGYKGYWNSFETTATTLKVTIQQRIATFHNNYIEMAVAFGVIGVLALVWGLFLSFIRTYRFWRVDLQMLHFWPLGVIIMILLLSVSEVPVFQTHALFQMLLVICALSGSPLARTTHQKLDALARES